MQHHSQHHATSFTSLADSAVTKELHAFALQTA